MNLYKIMFEHFSQKDSQTGIKCFLLAEDDEQVYEWLKSDPRLGEDWITTCYEDFEEEDEEGNFKERLIACQGEMFDEYYEPTDLYYGAIAYGWEAIGEWSEEYLKVLSSNNLLWNAKEK